MFSRGRIATSPARPASSISARRPTVLARIGIVFGSIIDWLRAGYPDHAPPHPVFEATNRLPTEMQARAVAYALHAPPSTNPLH